MEKMRAFQYNNKNIRERGDKKHKTVMEAHFKRQSENFLLLKLAEKNFQNAGTEKEKKDDDIRKENKSRNEKKEKEKKRNAKVSFKSSTNNNDTINNDDNNNNINNNKAPNKIKNLKEKKHRHHKNHSYDMNAEYDINNKNIVNKAKIDIIDLSKEEKNSDINTEENLKNNLKIKQKETNSNDEIAHSHTMENKVRSSSMEKPSKAYTDLVKRIKSQMIIDESNSILKSKTKNKKKKNVFFNFLNKFVNKDSISLTTKYSSNSYINNEENSKRSQEFKNLSVKRNINLMIKSKINGKKSKILKEEDSNEIIKVKNELEMKDKKIEELLKEIEKYKNINIEISNKYNNIFHENKKLKEEINNLKNNINNSNNINNIKVISNLNKDDDSKKEESLKNTHLNSFNENTINNYKVIKNEVNDSNNNNNTDSNINNNNIFNTNKETHENKEKKESIIENISLSLRDTNSNINTNKENEQESAQERRARKATQAFDRFRRRHKYLSQEKDLQKSMKISNMAQMLENNMTQIKNLEKINKNSFDSGTIYDNENSKIDYNNGIVDLIDKQPVINKKKKKIRSFSVDA